MEAKTYIVEWLKDGRVTSEGRFADLKDARVHAFEQIKLYRALNRATSALVRDEAGAELIRVF